MEIVTDPKQPWKGKMVECVCGERFPYPSTTKKEKQAVSFHQNDCEVAKQAREDEQERREEAERSFEYSMLFDQLTEGEVFSSLEAKRLIEVFGNL